METYRASRKENLACKEVIENAIRDSYKDNRLDSAGAKAVVNEFGFDRTLYVLAVTVKRMDWDGRFSRDNKNWAQLTPVIPDTNGFGDDRNHDFALSHSHPGLIDLFLTQTRHEQLLATPLKVADIKMEALNLLAKLENLPVPNSPDGNHFMTEVSEDFLARAKSKDMDKLASMLPFESGALSTVKERKGVFLIIGKDEDRHQGLVKRKSVLAKLNETKPQQGDKPAPTPKKTELSI